MCFKVTTTFYCGCIELDTIQCEHWGQLLEEQKLSLEEHPHCEKLMPKEIKHKTCCDDTHCNQLVEGHFVQWAQEIKRGGGASTAKSAELWKKAMNEQNHHRSTCKTKGMKTPAQLRKESLIAQGYDGDFLTAGADRWWTW